MTIVQSNLAILHSLHCILSKSPLFKVKCWSLCPVCEHAVAKSVKEIRLVVVRFILLDYASEMYRLVALVLVALLIHFVLNAIACYYTIHYTRTVFICAHHTTNYNINTTLASAKANNDNSDINVTRQCYGADDQYGARKHLSCV